MKRPFYTMLGNRRGMSLLPVILFGTMVLLVVTATSQLQVNEAKQLATVELEDDRAALTTLVNEAVGCANTLAPYGGTLAGCAGTYVNLRLANNNILVAAGGTAVGRWTLRTFCGGGRLQVKAARLKPGAAVNSGNPLDYFLDPVQKIPLDWNHPKSDLFPTTAGFPPVPTGITQLCTLSTASKSTSGTFSVGVGGYGHHVATAFTPILAFCGPAYTYYNDAAGSWGSCTCDQNSVTYSPTGVTFHGSYSELAGLANCSIAYIVVGK